MTAFSFDVKYEVPGELMIIFSGWLDENAELPNSLDFDDVSIIHCNFKNIEMVNSYGVKKWVLFFEQLENLQGVDIQFHHCPRPVVEQLNVVEGFLPRNGSVLSIDVPFFCKKCETSFSVPQELHRTMRVSQDVLAKINPTHIHDEGSCESALELDVNPSKYFRFLEFL